MNIMGIEFERRFKLTPKELKRVIDHDIFISFDNPRYLYHSQE